MNNRIKELAEQAWDDTAVSKDFGHPVSFAEKFAKLIVRECANIAYNSSDNGDIAAQSILFELNIDNCRNEK